MVKKTYIFMFLVPVIALATLLFSCVDSDNETTGSPICVITSMSVGDIKSEYTTTINGKDTTYTRTISGSSIKFNIDQVEGTIMAVDSLAYWADITRVVPTVVAAGSVYYRQAGTSDDYAYLRSGSDSIDFSKGVELLVVSSDGNYSKHYTAKINLSEYSTEELEWFSLSTNLTLEGRHRTLSRDNNIFVFAEIDGNATLTYADADKLSWTEPQALSENIDYRSVTLFNDLFLALGENQEIYSSSDGLNWAKSASGQTAELLLAADKWRVYAFDGTDIISSEDGENWQVETTLSDVGSLPQMPVSYAAYNLKTNTNLQNVVMVGNSGDAAVSAWYKVSSNNDDSNQKWSQVSYPDNNSYPMPQLTDIQLARYKDVLVVIGGASADGLVTAYENIYVSADNGITWHVPSTGYNMVSQLEGTTEPVTLTSCGKYLFIIQSGGQVWRGVIQ